jgi:SAM-dependent methyltransferase
MRTRPAGDFDYESGGRTYATVRRPDPRIAAAIRRAIGDASTLVNVGAGAGSYEPPDLDVTPVEPSEAMRSQRPDHLAVAVDAVAEDLPFADDSFDAGLATFTVHQWPDLAAGLGELRRVTRGPVVVLTADPGALATFWLVDYAPELMEAEAGRMPPVDLIGDRLGGRVEVEPVPLPADCTDGFVEAFFGRPESLLDDRVRRCQSAWGFVDAAVEARSVAALRVALADGSWDRRHGHLRTLAEYPGSIRLIRATPG